jgi:hypothetical protein
MREAIADRYQQTEHGKQPKTNPDWIVNRADLLKFAHESGERPAFLFPKERARRQWWRVWQV